MAKKNKNDVGPVGNTAPKTTPLEIPSTKQMSGGGSPSVRDAIRDAGSNGNVSKNELLKISKEFDVGSDRVIRQLDKVNAKGADNNKAPIGLGSAAYNNLLDAPTSRTIMGQSMTELGLGDKYNNYGSGGIGQAIMQGKGSSDYDGNTVAGTGRIPKGQQVYGSYNGSPQVQVKPKNNVNSGYYGAGDGTGGGTGGGGGGGAGGGGGGGGGEIPPLTPLPEEKDPIAVNGGTGSLVDGGATSFRRRRSSARLAGQTSRGTGQLRISPVGSASGINIG